MEDWAGLNDVDYESCRYEIEDGNATVTIGGKGKFEGLSVCNGTRNSATAVEGYECPIDAVTHIQNLLVQELTLNNGLTVDDTDDENIRYVGSNPNNKVYFNCKDTYNGKSYGSVGYEYDDACETWRIIGIFNVAKTIGGSTEKRIKIVRDQVLSTLMPWEKTSRIDQWGETTLKNNNTSYAGASLMQYLNIGESSYYNGLSSISKEQINDALWYTGAVADDIASGVYEDERSDATGPNLTINYTSEWTGKIGLIYPSDFGYAGINCGDYTIYNYNNTNSCGKSNNWLTISYNYWTISPNSNYSASAWCIFSDGYARHGVDVSSTIAVRPTTYLKSNIQIIGGDGNTTPFKLSI